LISCVDSAKARRVIGEIVKKQAPLYWLDMGNKARSGQCVLGEPFRSSQSDWKMRLPTVLELYPELLDESIPEDDAPTCSLAEALEKQGLYINRAVSMFGLNMLESLIRQGHLQHNAVFVDLERSVTTNLQVSQEAWAMMGYQSKSSNDKRPTFY
jgi:PRTRC genetic system ThiF family protein